MAVLSGGVARLAFDDGYFAAAFDVVNHPLGGFSASLLVVGRYDGGNLDTRVRSSFRVYFLINVDDGHVLLGRINETWDQVQRSDGRDHDGVVTFGQALLQQTELLVGV